MVITWFWRNNIIALVVNFHLEVLLHQNINGRSIRDASAFHRVQSDSVNTFVFLLCEPDQIFDSVADWPQCEFALLIS